MADEEAARVEIYRVILNPPILAEALSIETRLRDQPAAVKIRFDNDRTRPDADIPGDIAKAWAVRRLVGDGFPLAFEANNGYSVGGAVRVGRVLEELGYWWFEEPVQHYHVKAMGEVSRRLDITVSAGEQTYTLSGLADLIEAGVRMVQPDIVKMGGFTSMWRCAAVAEAHGVELVPHQTEPTIKEIDMSFVRMVRNVRCAPGPA